MEREVPEPGGMSGRSSCQGDTCPRWQGSALSLGAGWGRGWTTARTRGELLQGSQEALVPLPCRWGRTVSDGTPLFCPQIAPALPLPSTRKSRVPFRMALLDPGLIPQPGQEPEEARSMGTEHGAAPPCTQLHGGATGSPCFWSSVQVVLKPAPSLSARPWW